MQLLQTSIPGASFTSHAVEPGMGWKPPLYREVIAGCHFKVYLSDIFRLEYFMCSISKLRFFFLGKDFLKNAA